MRILIIILFLFSLAACKRECRIVKDTFANVKPKEVHIYPNCGDTSYYKGQVFYENGRLSGEGFFKNDKRNGHFKSWYENGNLEADWNVVDNKEHGFIQRWYENGQIKIIGTLEYGIENGLQKKWYENGEPESEGKFLNGKKQGLWKYWLANGEYRERNYINDTLDGATTEILSDKRHVFGQFKKGKEVGKWVWKDSLGNLEQTAYYKDGVYDSIAVGYYPNGEIREKRVYIKGKLIQTQKY